MTTHDDQPAASSGAPQQYAGPTPAPAMPATGPGNAFRPPRREFRCRCSRSASLSQSSGWSIPGASTAPRWACLSVIT